MIIRQVENKIYKINIETNEDDFMKANTSGGFKRVTELPYSKYEKYKMINEQIVNDIEEEQNITSKIYEREIQSILNLKAKEHNYDTIDTACSYASVENPFQQESKNFVAWRGNVWAYCYEILNAVKNGEMAIPTIEELIKELPKFGA